MIVEEARPSPTTNNQQPATNNQQLPYRTSHAEAATTTPATPRANPPKK
jgi:hypothetical protein